MEVASSPSSTSSSSPPNNPKPRLRLNPAALLLRSTSTPTPAPSAPPPMGAPAAASPPPRPGIAAHPLITSLSSLIPLRHRGGDNHPPTPAAPSSSSTLVAATRRAAERDADAEMQQLVGCAVPLFRPYVARLPWHGGARAWLSKLFPRYGHYCGPNWSSGKEAGSVLWDRRPADHLDFCCYCHDMAYDTHDQAQLLRADLAFLRCLTLALFGVAAAAIYRSMCLFARGNPGTGSLCSPALAAAASPAGSRTARPRRGGVRCACAPGFVGDGFARGTGCYKRLPCGNGGECCQGRFCLKKAVAMAGSARCDVCGWCNSTID